MPVSAVRPAAPGRVERIARRGTAAATVLRARARFAVAVVLVDLTLYNLIQLAFFLRGGRYPDLRLFWGAARLVVQHGPGAVYGAQPGAPWPYLNPPLLAWLLVPLAGLPFEIVFAAWLLACAAALGCSAALSGTGWRGILSAAAFLPTFIALGSGQVAPLLLLAVVLAAQFEREGRSIAAGVALSLLAVKPQLGLLVPIALVAGGRWRLLASVLPIWAVIGGLTIAALGPEGLRSWLTAVGSFSGNPYFLRWSVVSVIGSAGWLAALAAAAGLLAIAARRWRDDISVVLGLGILASVLMNHYLTPSDLVMLLLPVWALARVGGHARLLAGLLWTAGWLALWLPWTLLFAEMSVLIAVTLPGGWVWYERRRASPATYHGGAAISLRSGGPL